jgi:hypothetical protein
MTTFSASLNKTYGPPTSVTWLQLLRKQTYTGSSTALTAETRWSTRTRLRALSRLVASDLARWPYLHLKQETLWHKSCYNVVWDFAMGQVFRCDGLLPRRPVFDLRPVHMGFLVEKVTLGQASFRAFRLSPVTVIPATPHFMDTRNKP